MVSIEKILWVIFTFHLCCISFFIEARMPSCESIEDKCECHPSYTNFKNESNKQPRNCLKTFSEKKSWDSASESCAREFSNLVHTRIENTFLEDFRNRGVGLIWIGIKRQIGFYIVHAPSEYIFKTWENNEVGLDWETDEPIHECVALNISSGHLVTQNCSTELEYACQNFGFPVFPVAKSLACPKEWLFFYQLPVGRLRCIKPYKKDPDTSNETATCLKLGGQVGDNQDFRDLYVYMRRLNVSGFQNTDPSVLCVTKFIETVLGIKMDVKCSDKIFICERDTRKISLKPVISPDLIDRKDTVAKEHTLTCDVPLKSRNFSEVESQLHYVWYRNEIPLSLDDRLLKMDQQGTYRCVVTPEGFIDSFESQNVNLWHLFSKTYILYLLADLKTVGNIEYSSGQFPTFKKELDIYVDSLLKGVSFGGMSFHEINAKPWEYLMSWRSGNTFIIQVLVYVQGSLFMQVDQFQPSKEVETALTERMLKNNNKFFSLIITEADVCPEQLVASSESSNNDIFHWRTSYNEKLIVSEPMCLNDWKLVTRSCRPSSVWGATWSHFNVSKCTKSQYRNKASLGSELRCPETIETSFPGDQCFAHRGEKKSIEEAERKCSNQLTPLQRNYFRLAYQMSSDKETLPDEDEKKQHEIYKAKGNWFGKNTTLQRRNPSVSCKSNEYEDIFSDALVKECKENHTFYCIEQQFLPISLFVSSKRWYRISNRNTSYYFESSEKNWHDANRSCNAFAAKSTLLQEIRNLDEYLAFKKIVIRMKLRLDTHWTNLFQEGDSLKWLSSPAEDPDFVDWNPDTNFRLNASAAVITCYNTLINNVRDNLCEWTLRDLNAQERSICETKELREYHSTLVYVEDKTEVQQADVQGTYEVKMECIPTGWFIWQSTIWFKDGIAISAGISSQSLVLNLKIPYSPESLSEIQGYYSCSVALENTHTPRLSSNLLITYPGAHTFVLQINSKLPKYSSCSNFESLKIPFLNEFSKYLDAIFNFGQLNLLFLKQVTCSGSVVSSYHHLYIPKDKGTEKEVQVVLERGINSGNGIIFEALKSLNMRKADIALKSTVSCAKELTVYNGYSLTWPETPIGQITLPKEMCITDKGHALERLCLGDFNTGATWSRIEKTCTNVQSNVTITLYKLAMTNLTRDNILNSTQNMEMLTTSSEGLSPPDVQYVAQILRNAEAVPTISPEVCTF